MKSDYLFHSLLLLAAGAHAVGTGFTFNDECNANGNVVGEYFEPKQAFGKDLDLCVDSVDGHDIRSYTISKENLWTGVFGLGGDDICVMGFSEVGCGDSDMVISRTYETMPLQDGPWDLTFPVKSAKILAGKCVKEIEVSREELNTICS